MPPPKDKAGARPWIVERMIQRAQPHLSETGDRPLTPWLILGGILLLLLIGVAVVWWARGASDVGTAEVTPIPSLAPISTPTDSHVIVAPSPLPAATGTRIMTPLPPPSPTATLKPSPVPTVTPIKYRVQPGDTLSSIAQHYGVSVDAIMRMNGLHTETIYIGQTLTIPQR